jgi:hypothetical protein
MHCTCIHEWVLQAHNDEQKLVDWVGEMDYGGD